MADDPLVRAFRGFDDPALPDPASVERMFAALAGDLEAVRSTGAGALPRRLRAAFGIRALPEGQAALRFAWLAALLGLLLALAAGAALVANRLQGPPAPDELVRLSRAAWAAAPPIAMTLRAADGSTLEVAGNGQGTWHIRGGDEPPASYRLYDGARSGQYDASLGTWGAGAVAERGGPPAPFGTALTWTSLQPGSPPAMTDLPCAGASGLGESALLGRTVDGVRCPDEDLELWVDRSTRLVLRVSGGPHAFGGRWAGGTVIEAVTVAPAALPASAFDWAGPAGAASEDEPPVSTVLAVGERPPSWTGRTIEGDALDIADVRGPAAVLFFAAWCPPCAPGYDEAAAGAAAHPGVRTIAVGTDLAGTVAGFASARPSTMTVVADEDQAITHAWGIGLIPAMVLLDADGAVAGFVAGPVGAARTDELFAALEAGAPVPSVTRVPPRPDASSEGASPAAPACPGEPVTCIPTGERLPAWSGPLAGGGTFDSASLAGRPAVVWLRPASMCGGPCPAGETDDLRAAQEVADAFEGRVSVAIVSQGERQQGETERAMRDLGIDLPLVFDWDGTIAERLQVGVLGVIVLDADGRVAATWSITPGRPTATEIEAALEAILPGPR